jgi:hypothetical protein
MSQPCREGVAAPPGVARPAPLPAAALPYRVGGPAKKLLVPLPTIGVLRGPACFKALRLDRDVSGSKRVGTERWGEGLPLPRSSFPTKD